MGQIEKEKLSRNAQDEDEKSHSTESSGRASSSSKIKDTQSPSYKLEIIISKGLDPFNSKNETVIDVTVRPDSILDSIHERIMHSLDIFDKEEGDLIYFHNPERANLILARQDVLDMRPPEDVFRASPLDMSSTMTDLGLSETNSKLCFRLVSRSQWLNRELHRSHSAVARKKRRADWPMELICESRVGISGSGMRRVKVRVRPQDRIGDMIIEVENHFERSGLKFRCGPKVLKEDKTFYESGINHGDEITVTGGRVMA